MISPGAEILYKNAVERMLKITTSGFVVGRALFKLHECTHLAFSGAEVDWQIWIEDRDKPLPRKLVTLKHRNRFKGSRSSPRCSSGLGPGAEVDRADV